MTSKSARVVEASDSPRRSVRELQMSQSLGMGSRGERVKEIQALMTAVGFFDGEADGRYGLRLSRAVRQFQAAEGLRITGDVNAMTWERLNARA